jgi:hypothetical protein
LLTLLQFQDSLFAANLLQVVYQPKNAFEKFCDKIETLKSSNTHLLIGFVIFQPMERKQL